MAVRMTRRNFLTASVAATGGILIGFNLSGCERSGEAIGATDPEAAFAPNAWIRINTDGAVTLICGSSEMGQGVMTAIPMLIADELDADWSRVEVAFAPANPAYNNPSFGQQLTGGSSTVRGYWQPVREAGAAGRAMLISAAAKRWGVDEETCHAEAGTVVHTPSDRRLTYGELAEAAAELPVPDTIFLKDQGDFRYIGKPIPRVDTPEKVDGTARFGQDVAVPGALVVMVARPPVFGGKVKSFDDSRARDVAGVKDVFEVSAGVAVAAEGFWSATNGRKALDVHWNLGPNADLSSEQISQQFRRAVDKGKAARNDGNVESALANADKRLSAEYEVPYLAHGCMESMNCTARVTKEECEIWVPTQAQTRTQNTAMEITGLPREKVRVHTTFLGGGFGRRSEQDFVRDAVESAKRLGEPVRLMWTREDDTRHDYYRPATFNRLEAGLDSDGNPVAWRHRIAGPSIMHRVSPKAVANGIDNTSTEGAANLPYQFPNLQVTYAMVNPGVPVGFWRSVGSSQNAFITECFIDEIARAAGKDPYEFRLAHLDADAPHARVLKLAADKAGWTKPAPQGRYRGIAVAKSFASVAAQVAEISIDGEDVRVHRVVCAIDCGTVVNPDTVAAQMEGGIVYGLTAALKGEITIRNGGVVQSNFPDYPLLRMDEMPDVEVHIVQSDAAPGGVGEPGTPPIAPAVANAVFAATGKPVRRLPIRLGKET
jgi:isoquinoline 1-oxidoreductase beta subunit